jgi:hypothetical protein
MHGSSLGSRRGLSNICPQARFNAAPALPRSPAMGASRVDICNQALAELPSGLIVSIDEASPEAAYCRRLYPQCLSELLESHDWGFATRRAALAALANDRADEWLFAYAVPADVATPRSIVSDIGGASGAGIPVPAFESAPYFEMWSGLCSGGASFIVENGVLYSNVENATLEYGVKGVSEAQMPAMFARALALELASRLAMPIKKDRTLKGDLVKQAEAAKDRAMADDANRAPRSYGLDLVDEVAEARGG